MNKGLYYNVETSLSPDIVLLSQTNQAGGLSGARCYFGRRGWRKLARGNIRSRWRNAASVEPAREEPSPELPRLEREPRSEWEGKPLWLQIASLLMCHQMYVDAINWRCIPTKKRVKNNHWIGEDWIELTSFLVIYSMAQIFSGFFWRNISPNISPKCELSA